MGDSNICKLIRDANHNISMRQNYTRLLSDVEVLKPPKSFTDKLTKCLYCNDTIQEKCITLQLCAQISDISVKTNWILWFSLVIHANTWHFPPYSETRCRFIGFIVFYWCQDHPKVQLFFVSFLNNRRWEPKVATKLKLANWTELSSIESLGYICEDQSTWPLCGALRGGESLQRRRNC